MNQRNAACLLATAIVSVLLLIIACDDDKPTEPTPPAELKDYVVYTFDINAEGRYYGYHPATGQLDSFDFAVKPAHGMRVSADGSELYVVGEENTWIVSLDSFKVIGELPVFGSLEPSSDGRMMAIWNNGLSIVNTSDYSIVFHTDEVVTHCVFSADNKSLYAIGDGYIYRVRVEGDFPETRVQFEDRQFFRVLPSVDEDRWFLLSRIYECRSRFEVYDPATDSILYSDLFGPGLSDLALTRDGRYVFYSNNDYPITHCSTPPSEIYVHDIHNNEPAPSISFTDIGYPYPDGPLVMSMEVTPDGRWLVGLDDYFFCIVVVDLETMEVARHHIMDRSWDVCLFSLRCQYGL